MPHPRLRRLLVATTALALAAGSTLAADAAASANPAWGGGTGGWPGQSWPGQGWPGQGGSTGALAPRTSFTMAPDGSSGTTQGGEGIPNIDVDKKTIATYYGDKGDGYAAKDTSPYIREVTGIATATTAQLQAQYDAAIAAKKKPAIVLDTDDTTLWTYDMEVHTMHFVFSPSVQNEFVQKRLFPATPGMTALVAQAKSIGFAVFGLTGRNDDQKAATLQNLSEQGYGDAFTADRFFTKWTGVGASTQPSYITCKAVCTTVEYKAGTRKHIEQDLGYDITLNIGDQWSDLQGGFADRTLKLPNPTYYLPSDNLPGVVEPQLAPRSRFEMKADGSSGLTQGGEGIPNIDSVKKTIAVYYGDTGSGLSNKTSSPYITEMSRITRSVVPRLAAECFIRKALHQKPAIVLDADDTTLWTYDMEVADMHFVFDPAEQNVWVQDERFPATPSMVSVASLLTRSGCTLIGLTGRNDAQKDATLRNLAKVGYTGFTAQNYYTKWTGTGTSVKPDYISCVDPAKCTTIEYKSGTRAHVESASGGDYRVVANFGDQFSDLIGGHSGQTVKLPNPTYYLP